MHPLDEFDPCLPQKDLKIFRSNNLYKGERKKKIQFESP
jgi:hypothetical protein